MYEYILKINPIDVFYYTEINTKDASNIFNAFEKRFNKISDVNKLNLYNIFVINHEFTHMKQNKLLYDTYEIDDSDLFTFWNYLLSNKDDITRDYDEIYFKDHFYQKYHDYFFMEYYANVNAYIETIEYINSFNLEETKKLMILFNKVISINLLFLYKDIENKRKLSTPSQNSVKLHNHIYDILMKRNINEPKIRYNEYKGIEKPASQFDRLRLGLSINRDTYTYIDKVSKGKEKTLNLFDDIRNI